MLENINENTKIEVIKTLPFRIKSKFTPYFITVSDILEKSVEELINIEEITLLDIAIVVKFLNIHGMHIRGEETLILEEFWKPATAQIMQEYSEKMAKKKQAYRNMDTEDAREKFKYAQEVQKLEGDLQKLLADLEEVRENSSRRK